MHAKICLLISFLFSKPHLCRIMWVFVIMICLFLEASVSEPVWKAGSWCLWHKLMMSSDMMECQRSPGDHTLSLPSYPPWCMAWPWGSRAGPPHIALHTARPHNTRVRTGTGITSDGQSKQIWGINSDKCFGLYIRDLCSCWAKLNFILCIRGIRSFSWVCFAQSVFTVLVVGVTL